jgi:alpha-1,6-mannosyltransferase
LGLVAAGRWARSARDLRQLFSRCVWPVALYLLLTTTVHPWYLMPLVALLPFALPRWSAVLPFIYYSASVGLSYLTYLDPLNLQETDWGRRLEYLPLYGLLTIGLLVRAVRSLNEVE